MTVSQVKAGLDALGKEISSQQGVKEGIKSSLDQLLAQLNDIPTAKSDLIAAVQAYTPTGAFESLSKDELAKLTSEFTTLKTAVTAAITALG